MLLKYMPKQAFCLLLLLLLYSPGDYWEESGGWDEPAGPAAQCQRCWGQPGDGAAPHDGGHEGASWVWEEVTERGTAAGQCNEAGFSLVCFFFYFEPFFSLFICARMSARTHAHIVHASTYTHTFAHTCIYTHLHTHTHIHRCACLHSHARKHACTHTHTHTHKKQHSHSHTHTHTNTLTDVCTQLTLSLTDACAQTHTTHTCMHAHIHSLSLSFSHTFSPLISSAGEQPQVNRSRAAVITGEARQTGGREAQPPIQVGHCDGTAQRGGGHPQTDAGEARHAQVTDEWCQEE